MPKATSRTQAVGNLYDFMGVGPNSPPLPKADSQNEQVAMDSWQGMQIAKSQRAMHNYVPPADPYHLDDDPHEEARMTALKGARSHEEARAIMEQHPHPDEAPMTGAAQMQHDYHYPAAGDTTWDDKTWSDDPNFKHSAIVNGPILNKQTGDIHMGPQMQHYIDPEKHIERTSNYPGATGHGGPGERREMQDFGDPLPAYGGSTDARPDFTTRHRPTAGVWDEKKTQVAQRAGTTERRFHPLTGQPQKRDGKLDIPVHGAGLLDAVRSGEEIRSPAHLIVDPRSPDYGYAEVVPTTGGQHGFVDEKPDTGGFGHDQPVQWEGHHRVAAAALEQQRRRESGQSNWSVPVPFEVHHGVNAAVSLHPWIGASEDVRESQHKQKRQDAFHGARGGR